MEEEDLGWGIVAESRQETQQQVALATGIAGGFLARAASSYMLKQRELMPSTFFCTSHEGIRFRNNRIWSARSMSGTVVEEVVSQPLPSIWLIVCYIKPL